MSAADAAGAAAYDAERERADARAASAAFASHQPRPWRLRSSGPGGSAEGSYSTEAAALDSASRLVSIGHTVVVWDARCLEHETRLHPLSLP